MRIGKLIKAHLKETGEVLWYSGKDFLIDDGPHWAATIAFYGMLSIFPLMLAAVSIAACFVDPHWATERASELVGEFIPQGERTIRTIVETAVAKGGRTSFISIVFLIVAGTRVFSALIRALNVAYDVDEIYSVWKRLLIQLAMLLSAGVLFAAALLADLASAFFKHVLNPFPEQKHITFALLSWLLPAALLVVGFFFLYHFVPRNRSNWKSAIIGAVTATVSLSGARAFFALYLGKLADYSEIYGWFAMAIVLLVWAYIAGIITLFCGELASHIQMMTFKGLSGTEVSRRHHARSPRKKKHPFRV